MQRDDPFGLDRLRRLDRPEPPAESKPEPRQERSEPSFIPYREAALAFGAFLFPTEYVGPTIERFSTLSFTAPAAQRVACAVMNSIATGSPVEASDRDLTVLANRIEHAQPAFVAGLNPQSFAETIDIHSRQEARKRLREF